MPKREFQRLPTDVIPKLYNVHLTPNFETFVFKGKVEITADVKKSTDVILMNAKELTVHAATIDGKAVASFSVDEQNEILQINIDKKIKAGKCVICIEYEGKHNDELEGFYRTKCKDGYAVISQFEPTAARRALPCWDEPALKAKFDVKLTVPADKVALSNMTVKNVKNEADNLVTYTFNQSPVMSSYLLAFFVGEFKFVSAKTKRGVEVRIYTEAESLEHAKFALDVAVRSLEFYEEYFGINYPLPKCDMIAVPDFAAGAMENWGLITYRSVSILFEEGKSTTSAKTQIAITITHELAHQWFGNLVTMEWWTHLWLNEGFATFMEHLCVDSLFPQWRTFDSFVSQEMYGAMGLDAMSSSHPIEVEVGHPSEVGEIFDSISYLKGASVIRMLYKWIGDDNFRTGMTKYLKKHMYSNASTCNLWEELERASKLPVGKVMSDWTQKMGFPLLTVSRISQTAKGQTLKLSQQKFSVDPTERSPDLWNIPIVYQTANGKVGKFLMDAAEMEITIDAGADDWVNFNYNAVGFYHVKYADDMLMNLQSKIADLDNLDRLKIIADLCACCRAGYANPRQFFSMISGKQITVCEELSDAEFEGSEEDFNIWSKISGGISQFRSIAKELNCVEIMNEMIIEQALPVAQKLGFEPTAAEGYTTPMLRSLLWGMLSAAKCPAIITYATKKFQEILAKPTEALVQPEMKNVIMATVARQSDAVVNDLIKLHGKVQSTGEKNAIEGIFGCFKRPAPLQRALEFAFSDAVRKQDLPRVLCRIAAGSKTGRDMIWRKLTNNLKWFKSSFSSPFMLGSLLKVLASQFTEKCEIEKTKEFFKTHTFETQMAIKQGLEAAVLTRIIIDRDGPGICNYLGAFKRAQDLKDFYAFVPKYTF